MAQLVSEDAGSKRKVAAQVRQIAAELRTSLPDSDAPAWLNTLIRYLDKYIRSEWNASDFITHFLKIKLELDNHVWVVNEDSLDFDSIFTQYKQESRLPELFDEIVKILSEIQASGAVDSSYILRTLEKVISTIKKSKEGSYFSLNSAWQFLLTFLNNYLWGELEKVPMLGSAFEALRKTIEETDEEMFKMHVAVSNEMTRVVKSELGSMNEAPKFPFISYERTGKLVSSDPPNLHISA
jgi:hypothetical protein